MPNADAVIAQNAALLSTLLLAASGNAADEDASTSEHEVAIDVDPAPKDARLARRVREALFAELARRGEKPYMVDDDAPPAPFASVEVHWRAEDEATIQVRVRGAHVDLRAARDVDLSNVPADGRPLAIATVADDLVREFVERARAPMPAPEPPATRRPRAPPRAPMESRLPEKPCAVSLVSAMSFDAFLSSHSALVGPDGELLLGVAPVALAIRIGVRAPASLDGNRGLVRSAWLTGLALHLGPTMDAPHRGFAVRLGADAVWVGVDDPTVRSTDTVLVHAGAMGWLPLGTRLRGLLQVRAMAVVAPVRGAGDENGLSGLGLGATVGIATVF